jgi:hypothetical protein
MSLTAFRHLALLVIFPKCRFGGTARQKSSRRIYAPSYSRKIESTPLNGLKGKRQKTLFECGRKRGNLSFATGKSLFKSISAFSARRL